MNRRPMLIFSVVVVLATLVVSAWAWGQIPDGAEIPIHWGLDGQPNGYAPKAIGLLILPAMVAAVAAIFAAIPRFEPRRANLERSVKPYGAMWIAVVTLLGLIHLLTVGVALGAQLDVARLALLGVGAVFVVIGNYLPKVRPNYLMGIRTPWTLASDLSWVKTHRVGGRVFVLEGLLLMAIGLILPNPVVLAAAVIGAIVLMLVVVVGYSYRVWKVDPGKRPA